MSWETFLVDIKKSEKWWHQGFPTSVWLELSFILLLYHTLYIKHNTHIFPEKQPLKVGTIRITNERPHKHCPPVSTFRLLYHKEWPLRTRDVCSSGSLLPTWQPGPTHFNTLGAPYDNRSHLNTERQTRTRRTLRYSSIATFAKFIYQYIVRITPRLK